MLLPIQPLTKEDLLYQIEQLMPPSWLAPLRDSGPGYELLQGAAACFARCAEAVARLDRAGYIVTAPTGSYGTGTVRVTRSGYLGAFTLRSGSVLLCSATGRTFVLLADLFFDTDVLVSDPLDAPVRSFVQSYDQNVQGNAVTARGEIIPGEIDTVAVPFINTADGDVFAPGLVLAVDQPNAITGAVSPALEILGYDRGLVQRAGETVSAFRQRLLQLPDTVSPDAMIRTIKAVLYPYSVTFQYIETWDIRFQVAFDSPLPPFGPLVSPDYDPTCFVLDDPRVDPYYRGRCPNDDTYFSCFFVVLPILPSIRNFALVADDPALTQASLQSAGVAGFRATSAYDIPIDKLDSVPLQCAIDGQDWQQTAIYSSLYSSLNSVKPAGSTVIITTQD